MSRSMIVRKNEPPRPTSSMLPNSVEAFPCNPDSASVIQDLRTQNLGALDLYSVILCPISIATCSGYVHSRWFQTRPNCIHNKNIELKQPGKCVMCWEAVDVQQSHQVCVTLETTDEFFIFVNTVMFKDDNLCPISVRRLWRILYSV